MDPQRVKAVSYRFAIDAAGRTRSIARTADELFPFGQDIGSALAASRFPTGAARETCTISYVPKLDPLANAPIADLAEYSIIGSGVKLPKAGWDRFTALGNCRDEPRPAPLLRAHPDFLKLKAATGARDWSLVAYDTDASGRPINLRIAHGTNNDELDAAALDAMRASRFTGGARTGCLYPYWRAAAKLAAPPAPAEEQLRPANAMCSAKVEWTKRPTTIYPPAYRKRAIEGWAIVAFDTAPWGEVGNVRVLEAQPAADFGQQASFIVRSGRVAPSAQGASGCVETVKFLMPNADQAVADDEALPTE
ncbi:MAG: TonB family protein [Sphingopyxis sp.]|nr:TonB family protein [Sphingopyxis sp.]